MQKQIYLLSCPCAGLDVIYRTQGLTPRHVHGSLDELRVLYHHRVDNTKERLVAWEEARSTSERVSLKHSLTGVLGKDLDYTAALGAGGNIPLEVTVGVSQDSVEFVGDEFVRREHTERLRVPVSGDEQMEHASEDRAMYI